VFAIPFGTDQFFRSEIDKQLFPPDWNDEWIIGDLPLIGFQGMHDRFVIEISRWHHRSIVSIGRWAHWGS
jgi:hypothetical protein